MRYWDNDHMNEGWQLLMMLSMFALWTLLVVLLIWVIRSGSATSTDPSGPAQRPVANAEQILAERLARGDIDPEEFRSRLEALRSGTT